jgi:superfamily II DNA/RNA helicase
VLFSATYPEEVQQEISQVCNEAQMISMKKEKLQLDHISQYEFECEKGKKPEFLKAVFNTCTMTQTFIFVNSKKYAERLNKMMVDADLKSVIVDGNSDPKERDAIMAKFRTGEISVIITTNMLARGIDVPQVQIVINYDVPFDAENYLHRIGRTGRFGTRGIAINLYDREQDKN